MGAPLQSSSFLTKHKVWSLYVFWTIDDMLTLGWIWKEKKYCNITYAYNHVGKQMDMCNIAKIIKKKLNLRQIQHTTKTPIKIDFISLIMKKHQMNFISFCILNSNINGVQWLYYCNSSDNLMFTTNSKLSKWVVHPDTLVSVPTCTQHSHLTNVPAITSLHKVFIQCRSVTYQVVSVYRLANRKSDGSNSCFNYQMIQYNHFIYRLLKHLKM
jgi:hypothetical protein